MKFPSWDMDKLDDDLKPHGLEALASDAFYEITVFPRGVEFPDAALILNIDEIRTGNAHHAVYAVHCCRYETAENGCRVRISEVRIATIDTLTQLLELAVEQL